MAHAPITKEERDELRKNAGKRLEMVLKTREAIIATGQRAGEIECPCCDGGKVRFTVASVNGHVHAHCSTRLCVSWME